MKQTTLTEVLKKVKDKKDGIYSFRECLYRVRAKLFAEYYIKDYLEHLEIKEKKLYLEFKKKCLFDPCTKEILRDVPDSDKILEILT